MKYVSSGARFSKDHRYRYLLWREWRGPHDPKNWTWFGFKDGAGEEVGNPKACVFVMLNPSTADGLNDDATIRRCVGFCKRWNFERLEVVNLFAYRATHPKELLALNDADNPVGDDNLHWVKSAAREAGRIVCAWGSHGGFLSQDETVLGWIGHQPLHVLGFTADRKPLHPLRVPYIYPREWKPRPSHGGER